MVTEALETTSEVLEAYRMIYTPYSNEICRMEVHLAYLCCVNGQLRKARVIFGQLRKVYPNVIHQTILS